MPFIKTLLFFATLFFVSSIQAEIVNNQWLKKQLDNPELSSKLSIVDLRPFDDFAKEHIQGSANLNPHLLFTENALMPPLDDLRELFSNLGINHDRNVLVLDGGEFIWAARLYWLLETLGHEQVYFLDTAYGAWVKDELPISNQVTPPPRREFVPRVNSQSLQTQLGTFAAIGHHPIIDGRAPTHYEGKESTAIRFGHIPTAENFPCTQNYEVTAQGKRLRNLDIMEGIYAHFPKDQPITLYCDGGAEAALNYVVMQALGYQVKVYEGSWLEWGNNPALPIVNPSLSNSRSD